MKKQDLIKIIPKPKPEAPIYLNVLLWLSLILFVILVLLFIFYQLRVSALKEKKEKLENELTYTQEEEELEKEIKASSEKIKDFSKLFKEHKTTSNFFEFLKASTHSKVQLTLMELDADGMRANLSGKTESFQSLGEQILVIKENENVKNLRLYNIGLDREGKVNFSLTFDFAKELIKGQ